MRRWIITENVPHMDFCMRGNKPSGFGPANRTDCTKVQLERSHQLIAWRASMSSLETTITACAALRVQTWSFGGQPKTRTEV